MPAGMLMQIVRVVLIAIALFLGGLRPLSANQGDLPPGSEASASQGSSAPSDNGDLDRARLEKQLQEARRELRDLTSKMAVLNRMLNEGRAPAPEYLAVTSRAGIGVVVQTRKNAQTNPDGATIVAITPGGAAEEAGLAPGDVIVKFNGRSLKGSYDRAGPDESPAAIRLIDLARGLSEGDHVVLDYVRGGKLKEAKLEAKPLAMTAFPHLAPEGLSRLPHGWSGSGDSEPFWHALAPDDLDHLELLELNPDLGAYFGVKKGVLVVEAPKDRHLKFRPGDVLIKVDGYKPSTPQQAFKVLRSYAPGKPIKVEVVRKGDVITLSVVRTADEFPPQPPGEFPPQPPREDD